MLDAIKNIDCFPKTSDDFRVKTTSGALVSIASVIFMILLFFSELSYFYKTETVDHLYVNTTRAQTVRIDFDISFHQIPCNIISLDAFDDTGSPQKDAIHQIYKHRLSSDGIKSGFAERQELGNTIRSESELEELAKQRTVDLDHEIAVVKEQIGKCGNCYGAATYKGQCCNTCKEVTDAYEKMGWHLKPYSVIQCASEAFITNAKEQFSDDGGCQLYGRMELNKGSGHFHFAPHKKLHQGGDLQNGIFNLMDLLSFTFDQFNVSHTIHGISFGDNFPGIKSPLDGESRVVQDTHGMYQYYIKVVPTKYKPLGKSVEVIESNQYSVTEHMSHLAPGSGRGLPGVYFNYEMSPIQAMFEEKRGGLLSFITSVCAIIGGIFSVMGLLDKIIGFLNYKIFKQTIA
eukprot:gene8155-11037_t